MSQRNLKARLLKLFQEHHLLSANDILEILSSQGSEYNKTSVYRVLDQLLADELLCKHFFSQGEASYELRDHHHVHLLCSQCGTISTTECEYQPPPLDHFVVDHHHVTLLGRCKNCAGS